MTLRPWLGTWSMYSVLGLLGYVVASITIGILGHALELNLATRVVAVVMPALGFLAAVSLGRSGGRAEQIVFYRASCAAWLASCGVALCLGMPVATVSDLVVVLVGIFLAFGRLGCLHVACCHGRPARVGLRYSPDHVKLGFPRRWVGRRIFPVQLIESVASAALALACIAFVLSERPAGTATCLYVTGYALVRFPLELLRGDSARPYWKGLSEAQWFSVGTTLLALAYRPSTAIIAAASVLALMAIVTLMITRGDLARPHHLDEIERTLSRLVRRGETAAVWTSCGLKLSTHVLPDGTIDVVCSRARLRQDEIEHVASALFATPRVVRGATTDVFHVLVSDDLVQLANPASL